MMDGNRVGAHTVRCSDPKCNFEGELLDRNDVQLPPNVVKKKFEQKGWFIGKDERHDVCPACIDKKKQERRARRTTGTIIEAASIFQPTASTKGEVMDAKTEAPIAQATRDDKRIIFAKLNEAYINATEGYQTPWTDKKIAEDLGVPLAWVRDIREEMFGPASDNQEVREVLAKAEHLVDESRTLVTESAKIHAEITSFIGRANNVNGSIQDMLRKVDVLTNNIIRLRKSIEP